MDTVRSYAPDLAEEAEAWRRQHGGRWKRKVVSAFRDRFPAEHRELLEGMVLHRRIEAEDGSYVVVHAGMKPWAGPVEEQDPKQLLHGRPEDMTTYDGEEWWVFGHSRTDWFRKDRRPLPTIWDNRLIFVDTGAHHTGILAALEIPGRVFHRTGPGEPDPTAIVNRLPGQLRWLDRLLGRSASSTRASRSPE